LVGYVLAPGIRGIVQLAIRDRRSPD
jgi:hypothetical protein